jgi:endoglucanase
MIILSLMLLPGCRSSIEQEPTSMPNEPLNKTLPVSAERYAHLSKGINLAFWFWLPQTEEEDDIQSRFRDTDFSFLAEAGFTFVRLPIDLSYLLDESEPDLMNDTHLAEVDTALDRLLAAGLSVVVDIHSTASPEENSPVYSEKLEKDHAFLALFAAFWEAFAGHLARHDSERIFLELLNEPLFEGEAEDWPPMLAEIAAAARRGAPEHTLLVSGTQWSNIDGLVQLEPLADRNIIYYFHFYEPLTFTHQGADWAGPEVLTLHDIPYPSSPELVQKALSLTESYRDRQTITAYGNETWNYDRIRERIQQAADWAKEHHVRLLCDEFGAYGETIPSAQRAVWVKDVRLALESFEIGWAMWEYDGDFALVTRGQTVSGVVITPDQYLMDALGLKLAMR